MAEYRLLDHWVHRFVDVVGPKVEAPERFLYWAAVSTVSGAIRRRCYIDMGHYQIYPNWYVLLVGPPGLVKKSTTIDIATKLLRQVEGVKFGSDCTTWESFVQEIANSQDRFAVGDAQNIDEQEFAQSSAVTFAISEFGTFFDPKNLALVNMMTEFWDGKDVPFKKATKTQGTDVIASPFINIIAGTTPKWISDNFSTQFGGWGLSSRIIFLHCDQLERMIPFGDEVWGREIGSWHLPFLQDLQRIASMQGTITIPEDVRRIARPWYYELMDRIRRFSLNPYSDPWTAYFLQRKWIHTQKLATVLSVAQRDSGVITVADWQEAVSRMDEVENELTLLFRTKGSEDRKVQLARNTGVDIAKGLAAAGGSCFAEGIYRFTRGFMSGRETDDMISHMVKAGLIEKMQDASGQIIFTLLPAGQSLISQASHPANDLVGDAAESVERLPSGLLWGDAASHSR